MDVALRIVRYIKKDPGKGLLFKVASNDKIVAYYDADFSAGPMSRKYVIGFCIKIGDSLVYWKSKKQNTVARSSAEVEYRSMAMTTFELVWLKGLGFLKRPVSTFSCNFNSIKHRFLNDSLAGTFSEKVTRTVRQFSPHLAASIEA
ncbi:secreted RxLR effector protein 161-like [Hibiscus syriacus]|uniref:secreted RxLR effector protein 161-like n=1 Tax=Hibiscus syriacus TaxID=106335 RepID=UPI0019217E12|nr:secreted RxLR effector protein 161-like [Hibiscus syriacus]